MIESQAQTGVAIAIEGLTKRFGRQTAVDGLSLSVPQGSIFSLIGENGAGKTTTIQMLLGLLKPDRRPGRRAGAGPGRKRARRSPAGGLRARNARCSTTG